MTLPIAIKYGDNGVGQIIVDGKGRSHGFPVRFSGLQKADSTKLSNAAVEAWDAETKTLTFSHQSGVTAETTVEAIDDTLQVRCSITNSGTDEFYSIRVNLFALRLTDSWVKGPVGTVAGNVPEQTPYMILERDGITTFIECLSAGGVVDVQARDNGIDNYRAEFIGVQPGERRDLVFRVSFHSTEADLATRADAAVGAFVEAYPNLLDWPDRRPIGKFFTGNPSSPHPRKWNWDASTQEAFEAGYLGYIDKCIANCQDVGCQGLIIWSLEGEEFGHPITYLGAPADIHDLQLAPELTPDLLDRIFQKITDAGLKSGVTIRPQRLTRRREGVHSFNQVLLPRAEARDELERQIRYCVDNWGVSIFYIDTNYCSIGFKDVVIPSADLRSLKEQFPSVLLIPEWNPYIGTHGCAVPFVGEAGLPDEIGRRFYPDCFVFDHLQSKNYSKSPEDREWLKKSMADGNIASIRAWFDDDNSRVVKELVAELGITAPDEEPLPDDPTEPEPEPEPLTLEERVAALERRVDAMEAGE